MKGEAEIVKEKQDVVVVGAGCAGLCAAIAACDAGAKTTVMEKAPHLKDTNTYRAGGFVSFEKGWETRVGFDRELTPEEKTQVALKVNEGHADPELISILWENFNDTMSWLTEHGLVWFGGKGTISHPIGESHQIRGAGAGLNNQLRQIAEEKGARVLFNTKARKLLADAKGGVAGVRAMTEEGLKDFESRGVVLATSGFQANQEMMIRYIGADFAHAIRLTGSPYSTGDGHLMAQEMGAKMLSMDQFECRTIDKTWRPGSPGQVGPFRALGGFVFSCILVNKLGKRYMDESYANHSDIAASILLQPDSVASFIFDENIRMIAPDEVARYERTRPGIIIRADTIEELAQKIDVSPEALKKTIEEYNQALKDGKATGLDVPKQGFGLRIETPPSVLSTRCGVG